MARPEEYGEYVDDFTIRDDAELWRRIKPIWVVPDKNRGGWRISSAAFQNQKGWGGFSVAIAREVEVAGRTVEDFLGTHRDYGVASLTAGFVRGLGRGIERQPVEDEPAHAVVFGKDTKGIRRAFSKAAQWVLEPAEKSKEDSPSAT